MSEKTWSNGWHGEGWYSVKFSDGGQDFTNDGPVWVETYWLLDELLGAAEVASSDTHLPYVEYYGSFSKPVDMDEVEPYDRLSLESYLGDFVGDFDVELIELYATECDERGRRYWIVSEDELIEIVKVCEIGSVSSASKIETLEQMRRAYVI